MKVPESLRDRLRDNRWVVGRILLALVVFTVAYYVVLRSRDLDPALVNNRILLFVLRNVNVVLVVSLAFVLLRNLFKLWLERHHRILGSKFKTKLVATYIGLTLIPVLLLFAYATELLQGSIDNLFRVPTQELLRPANDVAQALTSTLQQVSERDARHVLDAIDRVDLRDADRRPQLDRLLRRQLVHLDPDLIAVYEETDFVHAVLNPRAGLRDLPEVDPSLLLDAVREGRALKVDEMPTRPERLILAATADGVAEGVPTKIVVVGRVLDAQLSEQTATLVGAFQTMRQLEVQKPDIKAAYLLLFLMVTLVILLASSWMGLYLARRVTVPIQALADGTRRIMSGDLDYRVEAADDDELGILVDSFNRMTEELQGNRELVEQRTQELLTSNRQLDEERQFVAAVLENVPAGVLAVGADGSVLTFNTAALEMLRLREADLHDRSLTDALAADSQRAPLAELLDSDRPSPRARRDEIRLALGGEWKTFEVTRTPMHDDEGNVTGFVLVLEDLTELIEAQRLATWNDAARRIAHEIKNPLTPIKLSIDRLQLKARKHDPELDRAVEDAARVIGKEISSMKGMVDEFSRFARMPRTQLSRVDLAKMLDETINLYRDIKPGVAISAHTDGDVSAASLDAEQVRGALVNLIDNAIEATEAPGEVEVSATRDNGYVRIEVRDTGQGIPPEAREKLFLPYYSTKGRGTGLGLAIVHRIVSDHHGSIRIEDNRPRGTVFTIELPQ